VVGPQSYRDIVQGTHDAANEVWDSGLGFQVSGLGFRAPMTLQTRFVIRIWGYRITGLEPKMCATR
jgi:hypothetical protein